MRSSRPRVLLVEDDDAIRGFLVPGLIDEGYDVREADNGRAALDVLSTWKADVILLDLMMPTMDGWAFRDAQRQSVELRDIPVVLLSATRRSQAAAEAAQLGVAAFIAKPFEIDGLFATIEHVLAGGRWDPTKEPVA